MLDLKFEVFLEMILMAVDSNLLMTFLPELIVVDCWKIYEHEINQFITKGLHVFIALFKEIFSPQNLW